MSNNFTIYVRADGMSAEEISRFVSGLVSSGCSIESVGHRYPTISERRKAAGTAGNGGLPAYNDRMRIMNGHGGVVVLEGASTGALHLVLPTEDTAFIVHA